MMNYIFLDENHYQVVAGVTGLEPATSCVTGRRSNQTSYTPYLMVGGKGLEPMTLSVKRDALPTGQPPKLNKTEVYNKNFIK